MIAAALIVSNCEREPIEENEEEQDDVEEVTEGIVNNAVTDYDGNSYDAIWIGDQLWMKENLRTTHFANGTSIPLGFTTSSSVAYRYYPENNPSYVSTYGYLYNWRAVMYEDFSSNENPSGVQGICPDGWHVPSESEWAQLVDYVSSQTQYLCADGIAKALADSTGWVTSDITCAVGNHQEENNATCFSAKPAGEYQGDGWLMLGQSAKFWSSTSFPNNNNEAWFYELDKDFAQFGKSAFYKKRAKSVRCIRD